MDNTEKGFKLIKDLEGLPKPRVDEYDKVLKTETYRMDTAELDTMADNKFINGLVTELKKMMQPDEELVDIRLDRKYDVFNTDITLTGFVRKK